MDSGVWFIALNTGSGDYAMNSAVSIKKHNPDLRISIATDQKVDRSLFDQVFDIPSILQEPWIKDQPGYPHQGYFAKVRYMYSSPYEYTLFLDTDTHVVTDIANIFELLVGGGYDLAIAHAPSKPPTPLNASVPPSFMLFNTGVIAFRKNDAVARLMADWYARFLAHQDPWADESIFMMTLYEHHDIRYAVLPQEYNCRFIYPRVVSDRVAIFHGRVPDSNYQPFVERINREIHAIRLCYNQRVMIYNFQKGTIEDMP